MASPNVYPAAFRLLGPDIAALAGNYVSGSVLWVDSTSSAASDANAGTEPELPKATWTSAYTAAAANDLILCQPGHAEIISGAATLGTAGVTTISLGTGTQRARFTSAVAGAMWTITGAGTGFVNCYFPASTAATTSRINNSTGTELWLNGCYFECGANDTTNTVVLAANSPRLEDCAFVATASRPARAVQITGAITDAILTRLSFDGGAFGWSSPALGVTAAATRMLFQDITLANRSDFVTTVTASTYKFFGVRAIDNTGSRIVIAA